jgi:hypothetical protein
VFHPFAGDWQGIFKSSEAWHHAGDAAQAMTRNHAGLVASTPQTWQGLSGDSFRAAMAAIAGATDGLSAAYSYAGDLVKTLSTVTKLACSAIGSLLKLIADKLLKMAAEAATPLIGWAIGALTAYSDIQDIITWVRRINTLIETISSAIQDFAEAKTSILGKYRILEDLAQGAVTSVAA